MPPPANLDLLMQQYEPMVRAAVGRFLRRLPANVERADLLAAGRVGLWQVLASGSRNPRHMRLRIYGAIVDDLRAQDWLSRRVRQSLPDMRMVSFDEMIGEGYDRATPPDVAQADARRMLERHLRNLPDRELALVVGSFLEGLPHAALAARFGISEARVSQLLTRALGRLRAAIGKVDL